MITIIVFILILGLLVFVHELGHFVMARKFGVRAEEFGFGFPPRLFGWQKDSNGKLKFFWRHQAPLEEKVKDEESGRDFYLNKGDTIYSLNLIPLGGFVKIKGEMGEDIDAKDSMANKSAGKRSLILAAGVTMNVLLTMVLISIGLMIGLPQIIDEDIPASATVKEEKIQLSYIYEKSPAAEAGLKRGDVVLGIDNRKFNNITEIQKYISGKNGEEVEVRVNRLGVGNTLEIMEKKDNSDPTAEETGVLTKKLKIVSKAELFTGEDGENINTEEGAIGVSLMKTGLVSFPWYQALWRGAVMTVSLLKEITIAFYDLIKNLIIYQRAAIEVAGPVGIAILTKEVTKLGFVYILQFAALLSLNLAIINILPIPALDGGRLLFILIEKIRRRQLNQELEAKIHNIAFVLLLLLIALITYKDIMRFIIK